MKQDDKWKKGDGLKFWMAISLLPFSAPWFWMQSEDKAKKEKPKSDALSTCGCLLVFVAIILLVAVCAA